MWVEAQVPDDIVIERVDAESLPAACYAQVGRRFGDQPIEAARSAVFVVPLVVERAECNAVANPAHPDAAHVAVLPPQPVRWNELGNRQLFVSGRDAAPE